MIINPFLFATGGGGGGWELAPLAFIDYTTPGESPRLNDDAQPFRTVESALAALYAEYGTGTLHFLSAPESITLAASDWENELTLEGEAIGALELTINAAGGLVLNADVGTFDVVVGADAVNWGTLGGSASIAALNVTYAGGGGNGGVLELDGGVVTGDDGAEVSGAGANGNAGNEAYANGGYGLPGENGWSAGQLTLAGAISVGVLTGTGGNGGNGSNGGNGGTATGGNGSNGIDGTSGFSTSSPPNITLDLSLVGGDDYVIRYRLNGSSLGSYLIFSQTDPGGGATNWVDTTQSAGTIAGFLQSFFEDNILPSHGELYVSNASGILTIENYDAGDSYSHDFEILDGTPPEGLVSGGGSGTTDPYVINGGNGGNGGAAYANGGNGGFGGNGGDGLIVYGGEGRIATFNALGGVGGDPGLGGSDGSATGGAGGLGGIAGGAGDTAWAAGSNGGDGESIAAYGSAGDPGSSGRNGASN